MTSEGAERAPVIVIGALPPPTHGYSVVTASIVEHLRSAAAQVEVAAISPTTLVRGIVYHLQRVWRVGRALITLLRGSRRRSRAAYLAVSGGAGVVYDLLLASVARLLAYRLFIHHHAFSYVDRWSGSRAALIAASGRSAVHICLCPTMAARLRSRYPHAKNVIIQSNAAFVEVSKPHHQRGPGPFRIGFMSNLAPEKGLDTVIEVFRSLRVRHADVALVLAGPVAPYADSQSLLHRAKQEFSDSLDYRGPIFGAQKQRFFADIDVFLFPTRYVNEAQPLVVLEALAAGVPVIATARGCIGDDLTAGGMVVYRDTDYTPATMALLSACIADRSRVMALSMAAHQRAVELQQSAMRSLSDLVGTITVARQG